MESKHNLSECMPKFIRTVSRESWPAFPAHTKLGELLVVPGSEELCVPGPASAALSLLTLYSHSLPPSNLARGNRTEQDSVSTVLERLWFGVG